MEEFTQEEQLAMPELNERVRTDLVGLQKFAEAFALHRKNGRVTNSALAASSSATF
jgi:hypothetical protein